MDRPFSAVRGDFGSPLRPGARRDADWNRIGLQIAIAGGMYPLVLAACLILVSAIYVWFDGPVHAQRAYGTLFQLIATLVAGFPFVLFSCFLVSTLVAVPMVSIFAWMAHRVDAQVSPSRLTVIGTAFVVTIWTLLLYFAPW